MDLFENLASSGISFNAIGTSPYTLVVGTGYVYTEKFGLVIVSEEQTFNWATQDGNKDIYIEQSGKIVPMVGEYANAETAVNAQKIGTIIYDNGTITIQSNLEGNSKRLRDGVEAVTQSISNNSNLIATTGFVNNYVASAISGVKIRQFVELEELDLEDSDITTSLRPICENMPIFSVVTLMVTENTTWANLLPQQNGILTIKNHAISEITSLVFTSWNLDGELSYNYTCTWVENVAAGSNRDGFGFSEWKQVASVEDIGGIESNISIVYVNNLYEGEIENGSIYNPFKTIEAALESIDHDSVIYLSAGTYHEDILLTGTNYNVVIEGTGAIGQRLTVFQGDITVSKLNGSLGLRNIFIEGNASFSAPSGNLFVDNVHFNYFTTSIEAGLNMIMDDCAFEYTIQIYGTPNIKFRRCDFAETSSSSGGGIVYTLTTGQTVEFDSCYNVALNKGSGTVIVTNNTQFKLLNGTASIYDSSTGQTNPLVLLSGTTLQPDGTYGVITQTSSSGYYLIGNFMYDYVTSTFNGVRVSGGLNAEDILVNRNPSSIILPTGANKVSDWLNKLDEAVGPGVVSGFPVYTSLDQIGLTTGDLIDPDTTWIKITKAMGNLSFMFFADNEFTLPTGALPIVTNAIAYVYIKRRYSYSWVFVRDVSGNEYVLVVNTNSSNIYRRWRLKTETSRSLSLSSSGWNTSGSWYIQDVTIANSNEIAANARLFNANYQPNITFNFAPNGYNIANMTVANYDSFIDNHVKNIKAAFAPSEGNIIRFYSTASIGATVYFQIYF